MGAFFGSADSNEVSVENGLSDRNSQCRRRGLVRIADSDNMTDGNTSVTVCQEDLATVKFTGRVILGVAIWGGRSEDRPLRVGNEVRGGILLTLTESFDISF